MKSTAKAVVQRMRQARTALVRVELTWTAIQFLATAGSIGAVAGLALWARRRQRHTGQPQPDAAAAEATANQPAH
ncbi:hypothetical protein [Mycobacterium simiae]|uniref:hypothetical protein n=1 Tax=Mycobacterium simiae TaxID=1784 RepID=UPI0004190E06|nr:hypothetical protein [Mycobacterium simiae]PLV48993.1 hypothetical protein X011_16000 [Mycobacterium tuberculosis variant microti OV254]